MPASGGNDDACMDRVSVAYSPDSAPFLLDVLPNLRRFCSAVMKTLGETVGKLHFPSLPSIKDASVSGGNSSGANAGGGALPNWF